MAKVRKLVTPLAVLIIIASAFSGCGGGDTSSATDDASNIESSSSSSVQTDSSDTIPTEATELEMWSFVELHGEFYQKMVDSWNDENPDEQIKLSFVPMFYDDMHNKYTLALQSGVEIPDLCDIEIGKFPNYLQGEVQLADLTGYIEPYRDQIVPSRLAVYSKDDKIYGVPTHVGANVAFYNTEILESAGVDYKHIITWDDFREAGLKVKEAGHIMGSAETNATHNFETMLSSLGADKTDENGRPTLDTPEAIKTMSLLKEFVDIGIFAPIPGGHPDSEEAYGALNNGEYATVFCALWMMSRYTSYMDNLEGKIAIAPTPVFSEGNVSSSYGAGGTGTVVYKNCPNLDLAGRWLSYAKLSKYGNEQIWNMLGFDPVNTDIWNDQELTHDPNNTFVQYFTTNPFDVLNSIKDNMGIIKSTAGVPVVDNILNTVTFNDVFLNGVDPETALKDAQEQALNELGIA